MRFLSLAILCALILTPLLAEKDKTPVTDDIIVDQVRVRLADDAEVGGQPIQVDAHSGTVVLTGKVNNDKLKEKAEKLAKKVKGVVGVDNKLVISPN
ncbi:MAG: BON domain-containing protein [Bryobacteraceae bacterium]|jgi:osmotically-inducible protein OsmY